MPRKHSMPSQPRHRAQAKLEQEITAAEAVRDKWRKTVSGLRAVGHQVRREEGMLWFAEQRLERLRRSKDVLAGGDAGDV